jgi:hypothetical protein
MIKSEVRSLLILNLVITPSLISERPLTIVSFEVLIKEQPLQSKPYYITGEVKSNANATPIEFGIDVSHFSNISAGRIKLIVTEKGAGVNTVDGDIRQLSVAGFLHKLIPLGFFLGF